MKKSAMLSDCRKYRYALWRIWGEQEYGQLAMFIGLNPSTADETEDDNTIRRCVNYAKDWGYGGLCMLNLFAFRAREPEDMLAAEDPVGPANDWVLDVFGNGFAAGVIIAAWGNDGAYKNRARMVENKVKNLHYLQMNKTGEPAHPLFLKKNLVPIPYEVNE